MNHEETVREKYKSQEERLQIMNHLILMPKVNKIL